MDGGAAAALLKRNCYHHNARLLIPHFFFRYEPPANLDRTSYRKTPKKTYEQRKADLEEKKERLLQEMEDDE